MKLKLLVVGKTKFSFLEEGEQYFLKKINRYCDFHIDVIKDNKRSAKLSFVETKRNEGEDILKKIAQKDFVVLMDDKGKSFTSETFAGKIQALKEQNSGKTTVFVVGGAYGFSDAVYSRANAKISLSTMTFSHQIIRVIFLEQLYRAFTIINGEPYHHA